MVKDEPKAALRRLVFQTLKISDGMAQKAIFFLDCFYRLDGA
jgi:hypothetical protein